jgi:hypothetical protein
MIERSILNDPIAARPTDRFRSMALTAPELFGRLSTGFRLLVSHIADRDY